MLIVVALRTQMADQQQINMETRLLQLELSMDAAKRDIEELKELLMNLTFMVNELNDKINLLTNG